jgi:2',3'-cyclic-nucleotide 2'-phosphodiesterase (5'-nucleotidase family)
MILKKTLLIIISVLLLGACSPKTWQITETSSTKIAIDSKTEILSDSSYNAYLLPIKQKLDAQMNVVIGFATETMKGYAPESLLSNFSADVYHQAGNDFLGEYVDISIVNMGGLRTVIPAGNITIGKVFELMPFENELVILWLRGDKLQDLIQFFARVGGEGVSGIRMEIQNGKAINVTVNAKPIDTTKLYTIATSDYLAGGNDKMVQLAQNEKRVNTGLKLRNILLDYIKKETAKGNKIEAKLDGRIRPLTPKGEL